MSSDWNTLWRKYTKKNRSREKGTKKIYNISRACLLNRSPVPAMDLKSNRSGLWCHMLAELVASVQTTPRDMIKLQLSQQFCRAIWASCRVRVTLCCDFYTFRSCNTCTFSLPTFARLRHTTIFWCRPVYYKTFIVWNSLIYTILKPWKWRHKPSQSSQRILACGSYSPYKIWLGLWRHFYRFKIV